MMTLDELSTRGIVKLAAATVFLSGLVVSVVWDRVDDLPSPERPAAWIWFTCITVGTTVALLAHHIHGWRSGALVFDTQEARAKRADEMKGVRSSAAAYAGIVASVAITVPFSPSFYVILGSALMGFLISGWVALIFKSTKTGRAMRAVRRNEPRPE